MTSQGISSTWQPNDRYVWPEIIPWLRNWCQYCCTTVSKYMDRALSLNIMIEAFLRAACPLCLSSVSLQWRHNERDGVSNHRLYACLLNRLVRRRTPKNRVTGLCRGNSPVTGEFPTQRASNAENVTIWWRHHVENMCDAQYGGLQVFFMSFCHRTKQPAMRKMMDTFHITGSSMR